MARRKTNLADVYIGSNALQHIVDVTYITPDREEITSEVLHDDVAEVIGVSSRGVYALEVNVELDSADTNGQEALMTAYDNKTTVTANYYPEGKTTGNDEISGDAYVTQVPNIGGQGKNSIASGMFRLVYSLKPTEGTVV